MITLEGSRDWTVTSVFFFQAAMKSGVVQILEGKGGTLQAPRAVAFILHTPWLGRPAPPPPPGGFHAHLHMVQTVLSAARQQVLRGGLLWELGNETG